jgi:hypothetical protein
MNQKLSWALLIGGLTFFLGQFAELLANHSTWHELMTPASAADMFRLLAATIPMIAGAFGIQSKASRRAVHETSTRNVIERGRRMPPPAAVLAFALLLPVLVMTPACATMGTAATNVLHIAQSHDPVQITVLAADTIDAANKLGEVVEQMRSSAHKLHQAKLLPVEADNAVQRAAIAFADAKDAAVTGMAGATTVLQVTAAAAPLVGYATSIASLLSPVAGAKVPGTAGLLAAQLPALLDQAKSFTRTLGGK